MDYDEGCWMMVMVMVMIVDIVFSSISWGRELRRSPWRALAGIFIEHIHPSRSSSIRNPTLCRTRLRPPSVRTPKGRIPKLKAGGVFPVDTIAATLCWRTSSREKIQRLIRFIVMVMIIIMIIIIIIIVITRAAPVQGAASCAHGCSKGQGAASCPHGCSKGGSEGNGRLFAS